MRLSEDETTLNLRLDSRIDRLRYNSDERDKAAHHQA